MCKQPFVSHPQQLFFSYGVLGQLRQGFICSIGKDHDTFKALIGYLAGGEMECGRIQLHSGASGKIKALHTGSIQFVVLNGLDFGQQQHQRCDSNINFR